MREQKRLLKRSGQFCHRGWDPQEESDLREEVELLQRVGSQGIRSEKIEPEIGDRG